MIVYYVSLVNKILILKCYATILAHALIYCFNADDGEFLPKLPKYAVSFMSEFLFLNVNKTLK